MADLSTPEGRSEARRLCEAATEGPWEASLGCEDEPPHQRQWGVRWEGLDSYDLLQFSYTDLSEADAAFIAFARTALPEALDLIERREFETLQRMQSWERAESALSRAVEAISREGDAAIGLAGYADLTIEDARAALIAFGEAARAVLEAFDKGPE